MHLKLHFDRNKTVSVKIVDMLTDSVDDLDSSEQPLL